MSFLLQHLKVARKLMCLLKLISNEPETEHDYQGHDKGSLNGARGGAGEGYPVIASSAGQAGDEDVAEGYKGKDRNADQADDCPGEIKAHSRVFYRRRRGCLWTVISRRGSTRLG